MKMDIVKYIINSKITSSLTFISFGLSFVSEYIMEKNLKGLERIKHLSLSKEMMDYIKYLNECINKKNIIDNTTKAFLDRLESLFNEKSKESKMIVELLSKEKDLYLIDDFNLAYINNTDILKMETSKNKKIRHKKKNNKIYRK